MPQNNVLLAYISGFISFALIAWAKHSGWDVPDYIASGLPVSVAVGLAHACDVVAAWWVARCNNK